MVQLGLAGLNMNKRYPIFFIPICDENLYFLKIYSYMFNKYYGDFFTVYVMGFKEPDFILPKNFKFYSIADEQIGGPQLWTRYIQAFIEQMDDEFIIFSLEDFLPTNHINFKNFDLVFETMKNDKNIGRCDLTYCYSHFCSNKIIKKIDDQTSIVTVDKNGPMIEGGSLYRISTQVAIWRRDFILKILDNDWSPWQFEVEGSKLSSSINYEVIGLKCENFNEYPLQYISSGCLSRLHPDMVNILGVKMEDIKYLVDKKLLNENNLQFGQWHGYVPTFKDMDGYNFDLKKMPEHISSPTKKWKELEHIYGCL